MTIKEVMAESIITIHKEQNIIDALKLMKKYKISRLPAISTKENKDELVGILTEKDMATKIASSKYENLPISHFRISTLMTPDIITADVNDAKIKVLKKMVDNKIGGIPIMDDNKIVGIVTKTDFMKKCTIEPYTTTPISEIMTPKVLTIESEDRFVHARRIMIDNEVSRLIIVDTGKIEGIISARDMAKAVIEFKKRVPEKYQESQIRNMYIKDVMSKNVESVTSDMTIADVAKIMVDNEFSGMPIVDDGKMKGIVTKTDILKFITDVMNRRENIEL
ncbi:MAG: CBS domain-containing protein [Methanobacteriaceae archaeon]|nr:CBS domain-containing protein [Methanobacteriaceae archaeon]